MNKKLSKYIAAFDYFDKAVIALSPTSGGVSIISFASVIGFPAGTASGNFTLVFSFGSKNNKESLRNNKNKKKKDNKILMLAKAKLSSIATLISQALIDPKISHEELKTTVNETQTYEKIKEDIRIMKSSDELVETIKVSERICIYIYIYIYIYETRK